MRAQIIANLSAVFPPGVVEELFESYEASVRKFNARDYEASLNKAGKFVEHAFRCLEYVRTGTAPKEIKSPFQTLKDLQSAKDLNESVSRLIPGVLYSMVYEVRSKKGAAHVKGIDPSQMDASLAITAASWVVGELLRLYHTSDDQAVRMYLSSLMRAKVPFIETIAGEIVITKQVPATLEVALLLSSEPGVGMSRTALGKAAGCSPPSVTRALGKLTDQKWVHQAANGNYFLTARGESNVADWIAAQPL
jgi:hypothetical protein